MGNEEKRHGLNPITFTQNILLWEILQSEEVKKMVADKHGEKGLEELTAIRLADPMKYDYDGTQIMDEECNDIDDFDEDEDF